MTDSEKVFVTESGRVMTAADLDALADELAVADFDIEVDGEAFDRLVAGCGLPASADRQVLELFNEAGGRRRFVRSEVPVGEPPRPR